ncbi:hypothetical protein [Sphingomonas sp.]|jgi:hypothetical protein|uniref:hypothetical protein n=1 Tax=Sphingomonas sp. TaxID=28214 RepID=UPI002EDA26E1
MRAFTKIAISAVATATLLTGPVALAEGTRAAATTPTAKAAQTSLTGTRFSSRSTKSSEAAPAVIIGIIATAAIIGGAVILSNDSDG